MLHSIILCVLLTPGLVLPSLVFAQSDDDFLLPEKDTKLFINEIQKEVSRIGGTIDILKYSPQEQAALTFLRSSSRDTVLDFLPGFIGTETFKIVLTLASSLKKVSEATIRELLQEIEKQTVETAIEIGTNWLFQNEIKTGSGSITHKKSRASFQYILIYQSTTENHADLAFDFYSPNSVEPLPFQGSIGTFGGSLGDSSYTGELDPFVIHVETTVERYSLGWRVSSSTQTKITVEFPEKVPRLELAKELPYPVEEQRINILNKLTAFQKLFTVIGDTGIEMFQTLNKGVGVAKDVTDEFFSFISKMLSFGGGSGLVDPLAEETRQAADMGQPVDNLDSLSFANEIQVFNRIDQGLGRLEQRLSEIEGKIEQELERIDGESVAQEELSESRDEEEPELSLAKDFEGCSEGQVNLNAESSEVLQRVTSIGEVRAGAIIEERQKESFYALQDITRVSGIGEVIAQRIAEEGLACVAEPTKRFFVEEQTDILSQNTFVSPYSLAPGVSAAPVGCEPLSININLASTEELEELQGIGPVLAQSIVDERESGPFSSLDDLMRVSGIAEGKVAGIKEQGCAYVDSPEESGEAEEEVSEEGPLPKTIVINEIAWMGTSVSASDEWVELLYNPGAEEVDFAGWRLEADDGAPSVELSGSITAGGYFLLERTEDDTAISDTAADIMYSGVLHNDGELLRLYDADSVLIDKVDASAGWFTENTGAKQSMERVDTTEEGSNSTNWANNNLITHNGEDASAGIINGTPRAINSVSLSQTAISSLRLNEFDSITLTKLGNPYLTASHLSVPAGKTLVVEPGVTVKFDGRLAIKGTLTALGIQTDEILFTNNTSGIWCGIHFTAESLGSELNYTRIKNASGAGAGCNASNHYAVFVEESSITVKNSVIELGTTHRKLHLKNSNSLVDAITVSGADLNTGSDSAAIYVDGGSPTIQNSTISDSSIGIFSDGVLSTPTIQNNTFTGNTYPIKLNSSVATLSNNTATGNTYDGVLMAGAATSDIAWQVHNLPYLVNQFTVQEGKTLTVQTGAEIRFISPPASQEGTPRLVVQGTLLAQGTAGSEVVFTKGPSTASWKRIWFTPTSTGSMLQHTQVNFGGAEVGGGALYVEESEVELQNVTIRNSSENGIYSKSSTITGFDVTLTDNQYAFRVAAGECPVFMNVSMSSIQQDFYPGSTECTFE